MISHRSGSFKCYECDHKKEVTKVTRLPQKTPPIGSGLPGAPKDPGPFSDWETKVSAFSEKELAQLTEKFNEYDMRNSTTDIWLRVEDIVLQLLKPRLAFHTPTNCSCPAEAEHLEKIRIQFIQPLEERSVWRQDTWVTNTAYNVHQYMRSKWYGFAAYRIRPGNTEVSSGSGTQGRTEQFEFILTKSGVQWFIDRTSGVIEGRVRNCRSKLLIPPEEIQKFILLPKRVSRLKEQNNPTIQIITDNHVRDGARMHHIPWTGTTSFFIHDKSVIDEGIKRLREERQKPSEERNEWHESQNLKRIQDGILSVSQEDYMQTIYAVQTMWPHEVVNTTTGSTYDDLVNSQSGSIRDADDFLRSIIGADHSEGEPVEVIDALIERLNDQETLCINGVAKELSPEEIRNDKVDPGFVEADRAEWASFLKNNCLEPVKRKEAKNLIKWRKARTYKREDPDDLQKITRRKTRVVLKGFLDKRLSCGLMTDSPTVNTTNLRTCMQVGLNQGWIFRTFDISTAFLRGNDMTGVVTFEPDDVLRKLMNLKPDEVVRCKSCVYGLADAPREWYNSFVGTAKECGWEVSKLDPAIFLHYDKNATRGSEQDLSERWRKAFEAKKKSVEGQRDTSLLSLLKEQLDPERVCTGMLALHVDDGLVCGSESFIKDPNSGIGKLMTKYSCVLSEGKAKYLGGVVNFGDGKIEIDYNHYIDKTFLIEYNKDAPDSQALNPEEHHSFRSSLGIILYMSLMGHPSSAYDINRLSSAASAPLIEDAAEINRVVKRIKANPMTIVLSKLNQPHIISHSDASLNNGKNNKTHAGKIVGMIDASGKEFVATSDDERAHDRHIGSLLGWKSTTLKRQVHSTRAAETISALECVDWAQLVQALVYEITNIEAPITHFTDCASLTTNLSQIIPPKEKSLQGAVNMIREFLAVGGKCVHIATQYQLADCLTKSMTYKNCLFDFATTGVIKIPTSSTRKDHVTRPYTGQHKWRPPTKVNNVGIDESKCKIEYSHLGKRPKAVCVFCDLEDGTLADCTCGNNM